MGFAVVDVNMRGTGCSGGAFDFFEALQNLDGYDVIETIAHQPWVLGHKVGMMGISYGAISQLFTAQLDPPDLEAISPLSTIDATATTLYPGGILNTGFAIAWAAAAAGGGRAGRAEQRAALGLHTDPERRQDVPRQPGAPWRSCQPEREDRRERLLQPAGRRSLGPDLLRQEDQGAGVHGVPVGGRADRGPLRGPGPALHGTKQKWFTFTNGAHVDSIDPYTFDRWYDFLELFVAHQAPIVNAAVIHGGVPGHLPVGHGTPATPTSSPCRWTRSRSSRPTSRRSPPSRSCPRFGCSSTTAPEPPRRGARRRAIPIPGSKPTSRRYPVPGTTARTWYLGPAGTLSAQAAGERACQRVHLERERPALNDYGTNTGIGGLWGNASQWHGTGSRIPPAQPSPMCRRRCRRTRSSLAPAPSISGCAPPHPTSTCRPRSARSAPTATRRSSRTAGSAPASAPWPPTPHNIFKQRSTILDPIPSFTAAAAAPMPSGQFVKVVIPLYYEGHAYRAGSRLRVTISAPNGTQPVWAFAKRFPPARPRSRSPRPGPCRRASSFRWFPGSRSRRLCHRVRASATSRAGRTSRS